MVMENLLTSSLDGFSPLTGINYVETFSLQFLFPFCFASFSPLTGINYVETVRISILPRLVLMVSVPLRGLIMWKPKFLTKNDVSVIIRFSPLTGINYVETFFLTASPAITTSFSPLTGINYVETNKSSRILFGEGCVSVPLRGLIMWKPIPIAKSLALLEFQSPYGD